MQRNMLIIMVLSSVTFAHAQDSLSIQKTDTAITGQQSSENNIRYLQFRKSMYQANANFKVDKLNYEPEITISEYTENELTSNWFINAAGGASSFLGNPLGCEDLFGRIRPILHLSIGKWFSPTVGGRVAFQGFDLKNHLIVRQDYYHIHTDFLLNITNISRKNRKKETKWQFIPFAGTGIIHNNATHRHAFTLNYGILNHLPLSKRLSLSLEIGGLTTFGDFDGAGNGNKFNDHLFHLSAGISITLGSKGWNLQRNSINDLFSQNYSLSEANKQLEKENGQKSQIIAQMHKILEIEGLLSRLQDEMIKSSLALHDTSDSANNLSYYPKNDYSGLNSLRQRLSTAINAIEKNSCDSTVNHNFLFKNIKSQYPTTNNDTLTGLQDSLSYTSLNRTQHSTQDYITDIMNTNTCIGSAILFFFHIGTSTLTDSSQLANIDEIARICKKYDLLLEVTGYADSATGNTMDNSILSNQRAHYIASELKKRNISEQAIKLSGKGGVNTYSPDKVNRCVKIEIHLKH